MGDTEFSLPAAAQAAWQAYRDMRATKDAHFDYLAELAQEADTGTPRTLARTARLDTLLAAHTHAVRAFRAAILELGNTDPGARDALLAHLTRENAALGSDQTPH